MEELLASSATQSKLVTLHRGQEIEGEVAAITDKEIILDLGTKSEGVLSKRDIPPAQLENLKVGNKLKAFVYMQENENGQTVLSYEKIVFTPRGEGFGRDGGRGGSKGRFRGGKSIDWSKFTSAQRQKSKLQGKVLEVNKGGLIVEVGEVRGFLPNSQVGFELMSKSGQGLDTLIGQDLTLTVIEVDSTNNKLIFSERGQVSEEVRAKLKEFKAGQKAQGKIVAILPFGLVVNVKGTEGLVFISDVAWEKVEDLAKMFEVGQLVEVLILGIDEELGRLNLSIKQLSEDPFAKLAQNFPADEVVKGEVAAISEAGVLVQLSGGMEGFLPGSKVARDANYEVGKTAMFLVDSVDSQRRRINLAPFVTSTAGLIYK